MSNLTSIEKLKFEKLFGMGGGYVLGFSNRTFQDFILENVGIDIENSKYDYGSNSKANHLRAFWSIESNVVVGKLNFCLLNYWKALKEINDSPITIAEQNQYNECTKIVFRLNPSIEDESQQRTESNTHSTRKEDNSEAKLEALLSKFDQMAVSNNHQERGYLLQDLLNDLFKIQGIPVIKSFMRNSGGEQIDGAFTFQNWHYLVESKWTQKLADIRELDSLLGKVNRSGKQTMGLFISIEGWSNNIPSLLKQNPEKCLLLMDGSDLRSVLNRALGLEHLLSEKGIRLNLEAEPYTSAVEILKREENRTRS